MCNYKAFKEPISRCFCSKIYNKVAKELMYLYYICSQKLKEKKLLAKKMKLEQKKQKEGEWYPLVSVVTFLHRI